MSAEEIDLRELRELIELMERHGLAEIEIEREGRKIRLRKEPPAVSQSSGEVTPAPVASSQPSEAAHSDVPPGLVEIRSPMVGTFYRSSSPEADPFVEVGDTIHQGEVLCIIEAMKVMNEVKAERSGVIEQICVENGHPVEYGEVLFLVRPE